MKAYGVIAKAHVKITYTTLLILTSICVNKYTSDERTLLSCYKVVPLKKIPPLELKVRSRHQDK